MDPHLLRTFVTVARRGSFSGAARELGYTQSAVSQHIAALETDLGAVLLLRRPVTTTDAGARLLEHAEPLLLRLAAARADIARLTAAPAARLVVGATPLTLDGPFTRALADLRHTQPRLAVTVRVLPRDAVAHAVLSASVDVGLIDGMAAPNDPLHLADVGPFTARAVAEQPLVVALPARHPLVRRTGLRLADLADARWIDAPDTAVALPQLRTASGADGYRAALRYDGTDVRGLVALVAADHGLALLPRSSIDGAAGVHAVPLAAPRVVHRIEVLHSGPLNGPAALLAAALTTTDATG